MFLFPNILKLLCRFRRKRDRERYSGASHAIIVFRTEGLGKGWKPDIHDNRPVEYDVVLLRVPSRGRFRTDADDLAHTIIEQAITDNPSKDKPAVSLQH